jgi:hypothetical protein
MRSPVRLKQLASALLPVLALVCAVPVAVAGAHGSGRGSSVVEVRGVVTTAPASGAGSFTATAYVVQHAHFLHGGGHGWGVGRGSGGGRGWGGGDSRGGSGGSGSSGGSKSTSGGSSKGNGYSYSYGGKVRGAHTRDARAHGSHHQPGSTPAGDGTPDTQITTGGATQIRIDGQQSSVSNLAVGDYFTAVYDGTPDESLSTITSTPSLSVSAWAPSDGNLLYAFVGTVSSTDTTAGTITVNVTGSTPNGLFSGTDTFDVGSQTIVLGNSGSTPFGSLGSFSTGDVVAGGLIAPSGGPAGTVESTPLQVLVDFPQSSSSSTSSANAQKASIRRAERRALNLLRRESAKHGHHKKK